MGTQISKMLKVEEADHSSPETLVIPYEDINTKQMRISGETFHGNILVLCDYCYWCCTCFNRRGLIDACPLCGTKTSNIPMVLDEKSSIEYNKKRGLTISFDRAQPLR